MLRSLTPWMVLALLGCPAQQPPPCPPASTATAAASALPPPQEPASPFCRDEVASLKQWLQSIEGAGLPLAMSLLDEGASLVERPGPAVTEAAPLVHVTRTKTYLDGIPVESSEELFNELTALIKLRKEMMPESPFIKSPRSHLAVSADVGWEQVEKAVGAMSRSGIERVTFLFSDPNRTVPGPPTSPIDAELERMKKSAPVRRGQIIAELMAYVYQDCQAGLRVIANMGSNPIADFKQAILDALPEALGACNCAPDDASVKALHWALFGNPRPSSGITVEIGSADRAANHTVSAAASDPWSTTHLAIAEASAAPDKQPLRLVVIEEVVEPEPGDPSP